MKQVIYLETDLFYFVKYSFLNKGGRQTKWKVVLMSPSKDIDPNEMSFIPLGDKSLSSYPVTASPLGYTVLI